ncbi:MAG: hypothetical protein ABL872_07195 [Lacibacter sp.]
MITLQKLNVYNKYSGDIDQFSRMGIRKDHNIISQEEWFFLSNILQSLDMVKKDVISPEFSAKTIEKLKNSCDPEVYHLLIKEII